VSKVTQNPSCVRLNTVFIWRDRCLHLNIVSPFQGTASVWKTLMVLILMRYNTAGSDKTKGNPGQTDEEKGIGYPGVDHVCP